MTKPTPDWTWHAPLVDDCSLAGDPDRVTVEPGRECSFVEAGGRPAWKPDYPDATLRVGFDDGIAASRMSPRRFMTPERSP